MKHSRGGMVLLEHLQLSRRLRFGDHSPVMQTDENPESTNKPLKVSRGSHKWHCVSPARGWRAEHTGTQGVNSSFLPFMWFSNTIRYHRGLAGLLPVNQLL